MDDLKLVIDYYQEYEEDKRLFRDNAHKIEFLTTVHYLDQFIKPNMRVLEVGAGTGIYSYYYANKGVQVTAFELVDKNINILNEKLQYNAPIEIIQGDARDLSIFKENHFDVVLCLGPLYHLHSDKHKKQCINECLKVVKPNGLVAFSYINNYMAFINEALYDNRFLTIENIDNMLDNFSIGGHFCFLNPDKIELLLNDFPFVIKHHIAVDGLNYTLKDSINNFNDRTFNNWFYYHLRTCEDKSILGYSSHGLIVGNKR
ncbi:methyltransferase domain-containing protein [Mycoplasmatota bacterium]|nr:methyltransferase domain-containing protein [Mycoplasmatota bacterium]